MKNFEGNNERGMVVAGCQLHYAVRCDNAPNINRVKEVAYGGGGDVSEYERASEIYLAE